MKQEPRWKVAGTGKSGGRFVLTLRAPNFLAAKARAINAGHVDTVVMLDEEDTREHSVHSVSKT